MEPIAHTLTGAALAETRLGRSTPLAHATLMLAANVADVDGFSYFGGFDCSLGYRRGWTHGPGGWLLLPVLTAAFILAYDRLWRRRRRPEAPPARPGAVLGLAALGYATHPLLDLLNTYGIRLLAPFSERWFYGDVLFILDPWLWLLLGGAIFLIRSASRGALLAWGLFGGMATGLVLQEPPPPMGAEIPRWIPALWTGAITLLLTVRARRLVPTGRSRFGERLAAAGVAAACLYIVLMIVGREAAERGVRAELAARTAAPTAGEVERLLVGPTALNPLVRQVVVDTGDAYHTGFYYLAGAPVEESSERAVGKGDLAGRSGSGPLRLSEKVLPTPPPSPRVREALAEAEGFAAWSRYPFFAISEEKRTTSEGDEAGTDGYTVHLMDARYVDHPADRFGEFRMYFPKSP